MAHMLKGLTLETATNGGAGPIVTRRSEGTRDSIREMPSLLEMVTPMLPHLEAARPDTRDPLVRSTLRGVVGKAMTAAKASVSFSANVAKQCVTHHGANSTSAAAAYEVNIV